MTYSLFNIGNDHLLLQEKQHRAFEFFRDSLVWLERCKYKSVNKHMAKAWQDRYANTGHVESIEVSTESLGTGRQSMRVLITFPWKNERHVCIWLDNHKTRLEDLKSKIKKYKEHAKKILGVKDE